MTKSEENIRFLSYFLTEPTTSEENISFFHILNENE